MERPQGVYSGYVYSILATSIRQDPDIHGFSINNCKHILNLFADDVILMLMNPVSSLENVSCLLQRYGMVCYYKVNDTKSYILDLGVSPKDKLNL